MIKEIKPEPNQDIIDLLESLMDDALTGELRSLSYVAVFPNQWTTNGWAGIEGNLHNMIAEHQLQHNQLLEQLKAWQDEVQQAEK